MKSVAAILFDKRSAAGSCFLFLLVAASPACKKSRGDQARAQLTAPAADGFGAAASKPEAEATASASPVRITLRLYKKRIAINDAPRVQIELKNIGKEDLLVDEDFFREPAPIKAFTHDFAGVYLKLAATDGRKIWPELGSCFEPAKTGSSWRDGRPDSKAPDESVIAGWRRQGLSEAEIAAKQVEFARKQDNERDAAETPASIRLKPGETAVSRPWGHFECAEGQARPTAPVGPYAEVAEFGFPRPGTFRLTAVFDHRHRDLDRRLHLPALPDEVRAETPPITFEVAPR